MKSASSHLALWDRELSRQSKTIYSCETFWKLFGSLNEKISGHWTGTTSAYLHSQEQLEQGAGVQIGSCHRVFDKSSHQCVVELRNSGTFYTDLTANEKRCPISGPVLSHHVIIWACQVEEQKKKRMEEEKAQETAKRTPTCKKLDDRFLIQG